MRMQQHSHSFLVLLLIAFIAGIVFSGPPTTYRSRVRRQNMKVRISATGDTIVMKFVRPNADTKLEGYILGYGSSMFSKQFIKLPENGQPYETEFDAEPKYLIAVQPTPSNEVKKQCTGKVELEKPLHVVIGSVTPTSVLLSWGTLLKTPYEANVMNDCIEDGHYMVRYREKNRKWNYQTCPTSDTVIDNLKPNTVYEFGVQPNSKDGTGIWSKPVLHNVSMAGTEERVIRKIYKRPVNPVKPLTPGSHSFPFTPQHVPQNRTWARQPTLHNLVPKSTLAPTTTARQEFLPTPRPKLPVVNKPPIGGELSRSEIPPFLEVPLAPRHHSQLHITATMASVPVYQTKHGGNIPKKLQSSTVQPQSEYRHQPQYQPPQLKPQPTQPPPKLTTQRIPQLHATSQPELQTKTQPQAITQLILQTHPLSHWPKPHHQSHPQTTPSPKSELSTKPTPKTKLQILPLTQPQFTTHQEPQAQVQPSPQPTPMAHPRTTTPAPQHILHVQKAPSKIHTSPQPQQQTQSPNQPQTQTQSQTKTLQTQPQLTLHTDKPRTFFAQPEPRAQSKPKNQSNPQLQVRPKKQPKPLTKPRNRNQTQHQANIQPCLQPQPPPKAQFPSDPLSKPRQASRARLQPQPGLQFLPQTRIQSDCFKGTLRKAVPTAPSPLEEGKPLPRPELATEKADSYNPGTGTVRSSVAEVPRSTINSSVPTTERNTTMSRTRVPPNPSNHGVRAFPSSKTVTSSRSSSKSGAVQHPPVPGNKRPNLVGKPRDHDKPMDLKQGNKESILKPYTGVTAKPKQERRQQTTSAAPTVNSSRFDMNENSSIFRPLPASEVDIMGKKRFVAPHVIYKTDKKPDEPCSITSSMAYFPDEEGGDQNVTGPPRMPPSNLTVVTVEGCPSFVILDWEKTDNETTEYEVVSTTTGPNGQEVSVLTTNQTHTAVENLTPDSSYEFTVTPKNEHGIGPSSDPVTFSTESADPRVSEHASGKDAIWTQFSFKADAYSECNGKQYVKRTWYRKFVGIQLCNSLRYKIYLSDSLTGKFYNLGDQTGHGEDHCQFVDSFLDGRTGTQMLADQLPSRPGFFRAVRQEPVTFGEIGGKSHVTYVGWYECGTPIPGKW
ncbi:target of Nesh-SH3 isoform X2 [Melanotaenia boesemani]|uniref:target of Nesh-SH3 isoform X2 n=1 Tax=Melanotaenia boesemani TaxID=1250792 RepID=UPI001C056231|nr:target of Nesh-SH3 isoform X2 [Melanotaenia boesemani]